MIVVVIIIVLIMMMIIMMIMMMIMLNKSIYEDGDKDKCGWNNGRVKGIDGAGGTMVGSLPNRDQSFCIGHTLKNTQTHKYKQKSA